jgi:hypothetical protein
MPVAGGLRGGYHFAGALQTGGIKMPEELALVGDAIKLLIGAREEHFAHEKELKLFRFKAWLIDRRREQTCFRTSGIVFTALAVKQFELNNRQPRSSPSERFIRSFSSERLRPLVDSMLLGQSLHRFVLIHWLPYLESDVKKDLDHILLLNALTECRVRLHWTEGFNPSKNNGVLLFVAGDYGRKCKERKIEDIRARRRTRESFLYLAAFKYNNIMTFSDEQDAILTRLGEEAAEKEHLKSYFADVKALVEILDPPAAKNLANWWAELSPGAIPLLERVTEEELNLAGIRPSARRSPETTNLGHRQAPPGAK